MIDFLAKLFIKDYKNIYDTDVRREYGVLCGVLGILFNMLLFIIKLATGFLSGSVSIITDAFNNLSDIGSSVVMIAGFKLSAQKPDSTHPFGHGRIEYVTGLIVSIVMILMGVELVKTSVGKIISPNDVIFNRFTALILVGSILVKLFMYGYTSGAAKRIKSTALKGVAVDSLADSVATSAVLLTLTVNEFAKVRIDGWCGLGVSLFILYSGLVSAKDTIDPLLGTGIDKELAERVELFVMSFDGILGVHDLIGHDYGPGRMMLSLHAEVPADGDMVELHDTIDNAERKLREILGCYAVIHMDPVVVNDEMNEKAKEMAVKLVKEVGEDFTIHDFRMIQGPTHTNLIFDVLVPYESELSDKEAADEIKKKIEAAPGNYFATIDIDRPFVKE